jgi:zinc protease
MVTLQRTLNPYPPDDVRYVPTIEEVIQRLDAVTLDQVHRIYTQQLGGQAGELAIVGDFDPETARKQVEDLLKDWNSSVRYERIARPANTKVAGGRKVIVMPDKASAEYLAGHLLALRDTDPNYAALDLANFLFGASYTSRLMTRLRFKEGLSYGAGSLFEADAKDPAARFYLISVCNPENIARVDMLIAEELDKLLREGVSRDELAQAKKAYLENLKLYRSRDTDLADLLARGLFSGRTFAYYVDLEQKIAALTADQIHEAVRKHWEPAKLVIIHAVDFRKK